MSQRLAWLSIADGAMAAALAWRWTSDHGRHHLIDAAAAIALLIGFLGAVPIALRGLAGFRETDSLLLVERPDALLLFPAEASSTAATPKVVARPWWTRSLWITTTAYAILMIARMWRWAIVGEPYTLFGAVTLSVLMLGFLRDAALTLATLGHSSESMRRHEQPKALLLFPAEGADANDLALAPRILASRRSALL